MNRPDPSLASEKSASYHLSIEIGIHCCAFCIFDIPSDIYRHLSFNVFPHTTNDFPGNRALQDWLNGNEMLHWSYRSSSIAHINRYSTLLPEAISDKNHLKKYLDFNYSVHEEMVPNCDAIRTQGIQNIYAVDKRTEDEIANIQNKPHCFHHSTVLINSILKICKNRPGYMFALQFEHSFFTILAASGKSLLFFNTFQYESPEDVVYYSLCVCEQLNLDASKIEVVLSGWIDPVSPIYSLLYQYFENIGFLKPDNIYKLSPHLTDVPAHRFYRLFGQYFNILQ